jgi:thymidylate synthase (FAD)
MDIKLISKTSDFLKIIWLAARTCKSKKTPQELWDEKPSQEDMERIAGTIIRSGHNSVLEHCYVTYAVSGVSRSLLAQYTRHRIGISISVQSQRSVSQSSDKNGGAFDAVVPHMIESNEQAKEIYMGQLESIQQCYDKLLELNIKKEDARFVLPNAASTNFVTTLNLRSLLDVYNKRVKTPGAQWEIKEMIGRFADLICDEEPWLKGYFISE